MKKTIFSLVTPNRVKRSNFDLSHEKKLTCNMAELIPVLVCEVVPGDKFKIDSQTLVRFAPLVSPVMHRINAYIHYFFVPNRIIFPDWEKLITGEEAIEVPNSDLGADAHNFTSCRLADYMGIPTGVHTSTTPQYINTLPFRAYVKIWNDYYRDQNLQGEIEFNDDDSLLRMDILKRCWEKDYFTSALEEAQKGNPVAVGIDLERNSPTKASGAAEGAAEGAGVFLNSVGGTEYVLKDDMTNGPVTVRDIESGEFTVESLRLAERLQRFLERTARAGNRYVEHLLSHWGVVSSDQRLQRCEYIGGGVSPVIVSEVLSNTLTVDPEDAETVLTPVGYMGGHGLSVGRTNQAYKFVEEHGYILGILSIMPEIAYMNQGIPRMFSKLTQLDFYFPEFATLGEQAIKQKEIYYEPAEVHDPEAEFGYQQRWAEYKYLPSTVHGEFGDEDTMGFWHLARKFDDPPALNQAFVVCDPSKRIFAVESSKTTLYVQVYNRVWASRPMPYESIPY